ncbi:hypothetical protein CEP54_009466 [Fusarium duplospermum]|uniref:Uncharacterized protein n=1 Tax=Fusarium duplospermum TaxID=1325734 RepID=A0A428PQC3_9HYPO|nr:hypothetical protein CEP54_009466 [Fusarium duplospermum]
MMNSVITTILLPLVLASPLQPRQEDERPTLNTGCEPGDLTPENWRTNAIDATISGTLGFGQVPEYPRLFLQDDNPRLDFQCSDLNNPDKCTIPTNFIFVGESNDFSGTVCGAFHNPQLGFIGQAWVNLYTHLRNINNAVQPAVDSILNSNFIDELVTKSTAEPLPIPKEVLFKLAELSLVFVPAPIGPELAAFRTIVPRFKKLAGKLLKNARNEQAEQDENIDNQPQILKDLLGSVPAWVQENMKEQNDDIFLNTHSDNTIGDMLKDGAGLSTPTSQEDYEKAISRNLKIFALAQMWTKISMNLLLSDPDEFGQCISEPSTRVRDKCMQFKYRDGTTPVTLATGEHPRDAAGAIASTGLNFDTVANNAIDCQNAGKTFSDVDFDGFLTSDNDNDQAIPACLFGVPVVGSLE